MKIVKILLLIYQKITIAIFGYRCRYYPSCSNYYLEATEKHGAAKGLVLGFKRILRCNQYFVGGYDPVP